MDHVVSVETKSSSKNGQRAGSVRWRDGKADVRLSLGSLGRKTFALPTCKTDRQAEARRMLLADLAGRLIAAGRVEMGLPLLEKAALREGTALEDVTRAIDAIVKGDACKRPTGELTIEELANKWTSGEIARLYPDRVKKKKDKSAKADKSLFEMYVCPIVRDIPVRRFTLDHAEEVMRRLPEHLEQNTRRHVAQAMHRLCALAVVPMRLLPINPLPPGFVPPPAAQKAMGYLYPDEEARLLGCADVLCADRIFYGFLAREGMRFDEAERLEWSDLDLVRGAVVLDKNKTNDPRAWALRPDTVRALRAWKAMREGCGALVFETHSHAAERLRDHLKMAGVDREILFEQSETRQRMRVHDLRATFVTLGLANGRTEAWITDRTGHKSSKMVNRYRRAARSVAELALGDLGQMDRLIPEIAATVKSESQPLGGANGAKANEAANAHGAANETSAPADRPAHAATTPTSDATAEASTTVDGQGNANGTTSEKSATTEPATSTAAQHEAPADGGSTDVATAPAGWSGAGPSVPELYRGASSGPKNGAKVAGRCLSEPPQPYSLRRGEGARAPSCDKAGAPPNSLRRGEGARAPS